MSENEKSHIAKQSGCGLVAGPSQLVCSLGYIDGELSIDVVSAFLRR